MNQISRTITVGSLLDCCSPLPLVLGWALLRHSCASGAEPERPSVLVSVTPSAPGEQLVRFSLPLPAGALRELQGLAVSDGQTESKAAVRVLTWHPIASEEAKSARRALVTFPYTFTGTGTVQFRFHTIPEPPAPKPLPVRIEWEADSLKLAWPKGPALLAKPIVPRRISTVPPRAEIVESNACFLWRRIHLPDPNWPRVIEIRADALGGVAVVAHLQRQLKGDDFAPDIGWEIQVGTRDGRLRGGAKETNVVLAPKSHAFTNGTPCTFWFAHEQFRLYHPAAPFERRGWVEVNTGEDQATTYRYVRCAALNKVPMQQSAWRRAEFVVGPAGLARLGPALEPAHSVRVGWQLWDALYHIGPPLDLAGQPELAALLRYNRDAILHSVAQGDDFGNVTGFTDGQTAGGVFGMNRLNHCAPMFTEAWRNGDRKLREAAVLWCDNFYDQSIWWGPNQTGGTRYNNIRAQNRTPPGNDTGYMWRSDDSVNFCTKGYDAFFLAYEETGDPRMEQALQAQVRYAAEHLHVDRGECRNIGDVRDFVRLYQFTGQTNYLAEALRLFRELRGKLSTGGLFSQGGAPLDPEVPFIDDDAAGYRHPFAKPYIIGYALAGLPELARLAPQEPKLRAVVQAVADFLAASQDPLGGWRYPHPRSSGLILSQGIEHAWQLVQADRLLGGQALHLDAIERVLRQRLQGWLRTGKTFSGLTGWEMTTGKAKTQADLYRFYAKPEDRDYRRDYTQGQPAFGSSPPEGLVYLPEVLAFYLQHRPAARLLAAPKSDEPLGQVLGRVPQKPRPAHAVANPGALFQTNGVKELLPIFRPALADRLTFPLSWLSGSFHDFEAWRQAACAKVIECLLKPPPAVPFDSLVLAQEDRGNYLARKVVLNLTGDSRVLALMLVPKGAGPFPAVLLLHDHGARFDIGKEKVIRPWDETPARMASAQEWVEKYYGGRFIGDELAKHGYVCFATDALNWSDRGGGGYEGQQALAGNLLHLGMSFAGLIAWEDLRAAEFLATRPEVDARRVAAMGLSMGAFRTWQVAALSPHINAGAAICWLATVKGLMVPGNNQTRGQSAFTMTHPGLFNYLDYSDIASLACPKPMLFYNGDQDALFSVASVKEAYAKLRRVWNSQNAGDRLETRLWPAPHVFSREMQEAAFEWLDKSLK